MRCRLSILAAAAALVAGPALADRIDGDWCQPGSARALTIDGPRIVTPGGRRLTGEYSRHFFAYTAPADEPGAGTRIEMRLLSEDEVEVLTGDDFQSWRRCRPMS
ncbi:hypothetical protein [Acidimangrovimonas sediminis]|uniref:hypothetical protein n=1 Tax=Acidimangrovimonas sediminis TaxID=2056283 RepID=UPI000C7FA4C9|nr:hypothetical protein [Acidimangrovimonas sediminis]